MTLPVIDLPHAASSAPLLVTLAGVAELAQVRRPVASMWRTRFAEGGDAFPAPVTTIRGAAAFDALEVADWLTRTEHGNNPDARMDAAASAVPPDFSFGDADAVGEVEALVALYGQHGALTGLTPDELRTAAATADPDDRQLRREVATHADRGAPWLVYVDRLIDAAYSAPAALALVARRHAAAQVAAGSAGALTDTATALVVEAARALAGSEAAVILDAHDPALSANVAQALGDDAIVTLASDSEARRIRRRILTEGLWLTEPRDLTATRAVTVARVPANRGDGVADMLRAVDEVSLTLRDDDAAVIIGPARALIDALGPADDRLRADVLRTGRVRGVARLSAGLVDGAPREALALWVLGAPTGEVAIAERFTVVADLTDVALTPAARTDLVSDIVAGMGSARDVRAHAFRFARFARTATLLARSSLLIGPAQVRTAHPDLPALLDRAADAVRGDVAPIALTAATANPPAPASVAELIDDGALRMIPGTRLNPDLLGTAGLVVVSACDLDAPASIGGTRVDQLDFATQHPAAALTRPGDIVFRTSPTAAAWVDADGSKIVAYPARVLRVSPRDRTGLVPAVIAADIAGAASGPGAWRRWMLRRVDPDAAAPLQAALAEIAAARADLEARASRLDDYAALIVAGATSGAVAIIDSVPTASTHSHPEASTQ